MCKVLTILVLSSACLYAQEAPPKGSVRDSKSQASSPKEYQGCVIRSGGKILLADAAGTEYKLVSSGRELDSYVGNEVKISGVDPNREDPSSDERRVENGQPQAQPATLNVETIQKVADHCKSPN
jgi:hypothetical protein